MKNSKTISIFKFVLYISFILPTLNLSIELNNTLYGWNKVISDENLFLKVSKTSFRNSTIVELRPRCRRFVENLYKPYQHIGTYVYRPYLPYIVPPMCTQCPSCCPRPCILPTPIPTRITHIPYYTNPKASVTSRTRFIPKTTKKGGFSLVLITSLSNLMQ